MKDFFKPEDFKSPDHLLALVSESTQTLLSDLLAVHAEKANAKLETHERIQDNLLSRAKTIIALKALTGDSAAENWITDYENMRRGE